MLPVELVVRGFLAGSGWVDYRETGEVCGHRLPGGLRESERLPTPIVTPATKSDAGHDLNISEATAAELCGPERYEVARAAALALYATAAEHAASCGIVVADTKFEFGVDRAGTVRLGDEALTPDSSRFWPLDGYAPGRPQPSFDKQYARDWCASTGWDRTEPGPELLAGHRCRDARPVCRGVRAADRDCLRAIPRRARDGPMRLTVLIRPKTGILDPQGEAVQASLSTLGFSVSRARVGRLVELVVDSDDPVAAKAEVERMCDELLANPLIESYDVVVAED